MIWPEQERLTQVYKAATAHLAETLRGLQRHAGTSTKAEYERLRCVVDDARVKSEQARLALEDLIAAHTG